MNVIPADFVVGYVVRDELQRLPQTSAEEYPTRLHPAIEEFSDDVDGLS